MAGDDDNVDLAAREAAQLREKAARDAEEAALRDAQIAYEDERSRRMAQNQPVGADQFGNIAPCQGRPLGDYTRLVYNQDLSSVRPPPVPANNFKLKQGLLQTLQNSCVFRGKMNEDPNNHLMDFEEIMNTFQYNGVSQDVGYLRAFPFTLKDDTKHWLRSLPHGSIRIWEEITRKFLAKYFSSAKTGKFRREIHNFCQSETETVFEAWERFKEIVQKCKHSGIELWMQLQDFWDGLTPATRRTLSNAGRGPLMKKTPEEIVTILDEFSEDANQWPSRIAKRRRLNGVHQVDANTSVQVQLDTMEKEIRKMTLALIHNEPHAACDICGRGYPTHECQASTKEVNTVAYAWQQNNSRFQGAPSFVNQPRPQFQPQQPIQYGLEDLMKSFIVKTDEILDARGAAIKELGTGLRNLERQVGQITTILSERIPGTLPVDTKKNPK
ncbi:uncharacterized protein [Nicotiana tomentosiformis]|uniref:uncharacterized protein n=1 Tax=Nicotiana tomentosiformis TaxID=4098 RepID=UPI00388CAF86